MPFLLCLVQTAVILQLAQPIQLKRSKNGDHSKEHGWESKDLALATPGEDMAMTQYQKKKAKMLRIIRTASDSEDFRKLVALLDAELAEIDGDEHDFYHQFNSIDHLKYCLVGYENGEAVVCGSVKPIGEDSMEVKRMYTIKAARGKGLATSLLLELENWAKELGKEFCLLETGKRQEDAVALYKKNGYEIVPNYGQYLGIENSVCFRKKV